MNKLVICVFFLLVVITFKCNAQPSVPISILLPSLSPFVTLESLFTFSIDNIFPPCNNGTDNITKDGLCLFIHMRHVITAYITTEVYAIAYASGSVFAASAIATYFVVGVIWQTWALMFEGVSFNTMIFLLQLVFAFWGVISLAILDKHELVFVTRVSDYMLTFIKHVMTKSGVFKQKIMHIRKEPKAFKPGSLAIVFIIFALPLLAYLTPIFVSITLLEKSSWTFFITAAIFLVIGGLYNWAILDGINRKCMDLININRSIFLVSLGIGFLIDSFFLGFIIPILIGLAISIIATVAFSSFYGVGRFRGTTFNFGREGETTPLNDNDEEFDTDESVDSDEVQ